MNITTHGKDGPKLTFLDEAQDCKRFPSVAKPAEYAAAEIRKVLAAIGALADGELPDQHREEDSEEVDQKLEGAGKK